MTHVGVSYPTLCQQRGYHEMVGVGFGTSVGTSMMSEYCAVCGQRIVKNCDSDSD